jgi:hypothetical protein
MMWVRSRVGPAASPSTYIGRWLSALVLNDNDSRRELAACLNGGKPGWNDDEPAVLQAVCELALRRFFGESPDMGAVREFVSEMRRKIARGKTPPAQASVEAVIRVALGEEASEISTLKGSELINIRVAVTGAICDLLNLSDRQINEMIIAGENMAKARGWAPPIYRD